MEGPSGLSLSDGASSVPINSTDETKARSAVVNRNPPQAEPDGFFHCKSRLGFFVERFFKLACCIRQ
jgi:hypothetical protein